VSLPQNRITLVSNFTIDFMLLYAGFKWSFPVMAS